MKLKIKRFDKKISLPKYENLAAGFDFYLPKSVLFRPGETKALNSNVAIEIPEGYFLMVVPRSTTFSRFGIIMPHSMGIVDPMYYGDDNEIVLLFQNPSKKTIRVPKGSKIAQGILVKYEKVKFEEVRRLKKSKRGKWMAKGRGKFMMES